MKHHTTFGFLLLLSSGVPSCSWLRGDDLDGFQLFPDSGAGDDDSDAEASADTDRPDVGTPPSDVGPPVVADAQLDSQDDGVPDGEVDGGGIAGTWIDIKPTHPRSGHHAFWTGTEMLVW